MTYLSLCRSLSQGPGETLHISTGDPFSAWLVAVPGLAEAAETAKDLTHDAEET